MKKIQERHQNRDEAGRLIKPNFFAHLAKDKGYYNPEKKNYQAHDTTMDYVQQVVRSRILKQPRRKDVKHLRFDQVFNREYYDVHKVVYSQVRRVIDLVTATSNEIRSYYIAPCGLGGQLSEEQQHSIQLLLEDCAQYIGRLRFSYSTMVYLLMCLERSDCKKIARTMFYLLFGYPNTSFYKAIQVSASGLPELVEVHDADGCHEIQAYNFFFKKNTVMRQPIASLE